MRAMALILCGLIVAGGPLRAQSGRWPTALEALDLNLLAGEWFEVATSGSWSHRRCTADTRFHWTVTGARALDVRSACTTPSGEDVRKGRIRAPLGSHRGRLSVRFAPALFAWLPAVWNDFWVLAEDPDHAWLLVGDRERTRLSVLSRWVSLDEASLARAIRVARVQGFDVDRLAPVRQTSGASGPIR